MSAPDSFPPAYPSVAAVIALRHILLHILWTCGVARRHFEDVYQECVIAAWRAIEAGRFRPDPALPLAVALRPWLVGIAWRQATHHVERAINRREFPVADPWAGSVELIDDPDAARDARDALQALAALSQRHRDVLVALAIGETVRDYARENGIPENTAWSRLRKGRAELAAVLARRGWRRKQ